MMRITAESRKKSEDMKAMYYSGKTYKAIGKLYGISPVSVRKRIKRIMELPPTRTIFEGLNKWLAEQRLSMKDLANMMGIEGKNRESTLREKLKGERDLKMHEIDKILEITGMYYEECFQRSEKK